jgi:hypothetical protein
MRGSASRQFPISSTSPVLLSKNKFFPFQFSSSAMKLPFGFVYSQLLPFVEHVFPRETFAKELVVWFALPS